VLVASKVNGVLLEVPNEAILVALLESVLVSGATKAKEGRDIVIHDILNAFMQTDINNEGGEKKVFVNNRAALVDILCDRLRIKFTICCP
jgi:hypothetical protein